MNIKIGILNVPKHDNKHDLIHFVTVSFDDIKWYFFFTFIGTVEWNIFCVFLHFFSVSGNIFQKNDKSFHS